jgi:TMEM199 family protein
MLTEKPFYPLRSDHTDSERTGCDSHQKQTRAGQNPVLRSPLTTPPTATTMDSVNVSLEPHLLQQLAAVRPILPTELGTELSAYIDSQPPKLIIPYGLLQRLSQWSRSKEGGETLKSKSIEPGTFSMISLLAGTTSSPEKSFGVYVPPKEPEEVAHDQARERKSITALVNAVFSVVGAGFAAWWGADKTGWRDEYVSRRCHACHA